MSADSAAVTVSAAAPGAPESPIAVAGNEQASVSFSAPIADGGSPITSYRVVASPGGIGATGTSSPIKVTGLTDGLDYTFTVVSTNAEGSSAPSAPTNRVKTYASAAIIKNPANLVLSGKTVAAQLRCSENLCRGVVQLTTQVNSRLKRGKRLITTKTTVILASGLYSLKKGKVEVLKLVLNSTGTSTFAAIKGRGISVRLTQHPTGAKATSRSVRIVIARR